MSNTFKVAYRRRDERPIQAIQYLDDEQIPLIQEMFRGDIEITIGKDRWDRNLLAVEIWGDTGLYKRQLAKHGDWIICEPNHNQVPWPRVLTALQFNTEFQDTPPGALQEPASRKEEVIPMHDTLEAYTLSEDFTDEDFSDLLDFLEPVFKDTGLEPRVHVSYSWTWDEKTVRGIRIHTPFFPGDAVLSRGDTLVRYENRLAVVRADTISSPISITED